MVDLFTCVCYQLACELRHDVVALAQSLGSDLHAQITHRVYTIVVWDRFLVVVQRRSLTVAAYPTSVFHIKQVVTPLICLTVTNVVAAIVVATGLNSFAKSDVISIFFGVILER